MFGLEPARGGGLAQDGHEELLAAFERDEHLEVLVFEEREAALRKLADGVTTYEEVARLTADVE